MIFQLAPHYDQPYCKSVELEDDTVCEVCNITDTIGHRAKLTCCCYLHVNRKIVLTLKLKLCLMGDGPVSDCIYIVQVHVRGNTTTQNLPKMKSTKVQNPRR